MAGELDLRKVANVSHFLTKFDQLIGLDRIKLIHFNDSGIPFGGRRDLHGDLMGGYITNRLLGGAIDGMKYLAQYAVQHQIPLIFETPCIFPESANQYQIVSQWITEKDLDPDLIESIEQQSFDYYQSKKHKK